MRVAIAWPRALLVRTLSTLDSPVLVSTTLRAAGRRGSLTVCRQFGFLCLPAAGCPGKRDRRASSAAERPRAKRRRGERRRSGHGHGRRCQASLAQRSAARRSTHPERAILGSASFIMCSHSAGRAGGAQCGRNKAMLPGDGPGAGAQDVSCEVEDGAAPHASCGTRRAGAHPPG